MRPKTRQTLLILLCVAILAAILGGMYFYAGGGSPIVSPIPTQTTPALTGYSQTPTSTETASGFPTYIGSSSDYPTRQDYLETYFNTVGSDIDRDFLISQGFFPCGPSCQNNVEGWVFMP